MLSAMTVVAWLALLSTILASPVDIQTASYAIPTDLARIRTDILEPRDTVAPGWTYMACFTDEINARALQNPVQLIGGPGTMTVEACNYRCEVDGYLLSGVEFGHECWCDHALSGEYHLKVDDSECSMECSGDPAQPCGGSNRIAIYEYNFSEVSTVAAERPNLEGSGHLDARSADAVSLYAPIGCYVDSVVTRMLRNYTVSPGTAQAMNIGTCTAACYVSAFPYAGLEYGQECFCDNLMQTIVKAPEADCDMSCAGDGGEICGGDLRINIYSYNGTRLTTAAATSTSVTAPTSSAVAISMPGSYKSLGCYSDATSKRTLGIIGDFPGARGNMTIQPCQDACKNAGYIFAGVEFGAECWCDNVIQGTANPVPAANCNMPCSGNSSETCGGPNSLNVYRFTPSGSFTSIGCYTDSRSNRTLEVTGDFPGAKEGGMLVGPCQDACQDAGYVLAGVEFGTECWCDNVIQGIGIPALHSDCNMPCSGNASETCGGTDRINIYQLTSTSTTTTMIPLRTTLISPVTTTAAVSVNATPSLVSIISALSVTTSAASCSEYYIVSQGDYCYSIWTSFAMSQDQFMTWNPSLVFPQCQIFPGDVLCVRIGVRPATTVLTFPEMSALSSGSFSSTSTVTMTSTNTLTLMTIQPSTSGGSDTIFTSTAVSLMTGSSCGY